MNKTKIEWLGGGYTFNPVTGCFGPHGTPCPYCYARGITRRFGGGYWHSRSGWGSAHYEAEGTLHDLNEPVMINRYEGRESVAPYPFGFDPTFHEYRLDEPKKVKKPSKIFVCSMADLFGDFIPDEWIIKVLQACYEAPQHHYLFLTKNPKRYIKLDEAGKLPRDHWYGTTITTNDDLMFVSNAHNTFLSIEPILGDFPHGIIGKDMRAMGLPTNGKPNPRVNGIDWIIVGAESGSRKDKVVPKKEWIDAIVENAKEYSTPVFMKNSLKDLMGEDFIQEWPKGLEG
jgi:protein gp37